MRRLSVSTGAAPTDPHALLQSPIILTNGALYKLHCFARDLSCPLRSAAQSRKHVFGVLLKILPARTDRIKEIIQNINEFLLNFNVANSARCVAALIFLDPSRVLIEDVVETPQRISDNVAWVACSQTSVLSQPLLSLMLTSSADFAPQSVPASAIPYFVEQDSMKIV